MAAAGNKLLDMAAAYPASMPSGQLGLGQATRVRHVAVFVRTTTCGNLPPIKHLQSKCAARKTFLEESCRNRSCLLRRRVSVGKHVKKRSLQMSAAADGAEEASSASKGFLHEITTKYPLLETNFYFFLWYVFNVVFNILVKQIYNYFPYPWFVATVCLGVGVAMVLLQWTFKLPARTELSGAELKGLLAIAVIHAVGHITTNVSFASVAVSFTHTIKALEPFTSAIGSMLVLKSSFSTPVLLSLVPVVAGVVAASMTELSFTWTGFISANIANLAFTMRTIFSKMLMNKTLDGVNVYNYLTIFAFLMVVGPMWLVEGSRLQAGWDIAVAKVGLQGFLWQLFLVGFFYHAYNAVGYLALDRVAPLTHAVGNVVKRIVVIVFSVLAFGNPISTQTAVGTAVAIFGVALYSVLRAQEAEAGKRKLPPPETITPAAAS